MTRFEMELSGQLGEFWKNEAQKRMEQIKEEVKNGEITIDEMGIARNCIGRIVMDDIAEVLQLAGVEFSRNNTATARSEATKIQLDQYKESQRNRVYTAQEKAEMENAFGEGETVVNVLTGEKIQL